MNKGDSTVHRLPKFFQVYLPDDSGNDLEIPISFNRFLPKSLPRTVMVNSIYGNVWRFELRRCFGGIENFVMVNGWKRIVKDEDLSGGEFLNFEFDGSRHFNFCIYGHTTCKRLRRSLQTKKMRDGIIILDDDDDGGSDVQDNSDKEKGSENIIVLDDDEEDDAIDDDDGDKDGSSEDVIVLDDDTDEDYGSTGGSKKSDNDDDKHYLDNEMNPFFIVNQYMQRKTNLRVPARVVKDYELRFPAFIYVSDPLEKRFGKLKRKVEECTIKGFESIIRRNRVKPNDKMICELEKEMTGLVSEIKIHIIRR